MKRETNVIVATISVIILVSISVISITGEESNASITNRIDVSYEHGQLIDLLSGKNYDGGEFTQELSLIFIPNKGYEFVSWQIFGSAVYSSNLNEITINSIEGNIRLSVIIRNYSTSQELINIVDVEELAEPGEELVLNWSFKSSLLNMSGAAWSGMPCTPLIVEDTAYVRAGGRLYALDIDSGCVKNYVLSNGSVSYYHYLNYGNGVIFDTVGHMAYDLELNPLYELPANLAFTTYHDGYFYGCLSNGGQYSLFKTSTDINQDLSNNVKQNLFNNTQQFRIFTQYGQFTNVIFERDWFFFLEADKITGAQGYRAITAFNIKTEESVTCRLTGFEGMPWDDGWLTYYDGYFYLTAYTAGLFDGVIKGLEDKRSSLMWVKFDFEEGHFEDPSFKNIQDPEGHEFRGIASGLVIYNGRGYLNVRSLGTDTLGGSDDTGSKMIAYEIGQNGEPFPKGSSESVMTHGGLVVNVSHFDENKIYVYMIPYNVAGQAVFTFTDEYIDGEWVLKETYDRLEMARTDWCSQCIRAGPNGEMLFYVDSGYIDCYVPSSQYRINIVTVDGTYAKSEAVCGKNVQDVLKKLYPTIEIKGKNAIVGSKYYSIYGLNEVTGAWVLVTNPSVGTYSGTYKNGVTESTFRQIVLLEQSSSMTLPENGDAGWYYFDGAYKKTSFYDKELLRASTNHSWIYSESKPTDVSAMFEPVKQVNRDSTIEIELPKLVETELFVSDDSIINVAIVGDSLRVTGLMEKIATITIKIGDNFYNIAINVLPKVTIIDGNIVTISDKENLNSEGDLVHTTSQTIESPDKIEKEVVEVVKDAFGNTVSERTVFESAHQGKTLDGQEITILEKSEIYDENGIVKINSSYYSETMSNRLDGGILNVITLEAVKDNLSGTIEKIITERLEHSAYDVSTITIEHYLGDVDKAESSKTETYYVSKQSDFEIIHDEDTVIIALDENGSVDISSLLDIMSKDETIQSIVVNAGNLINFKSVAAAASEDKVNLVMNVELGNLYVDSKSLKNLSVQDGNLKFTIGSDNHLTAKQQSAAGNAKVFSIQLRCGDVEQHEFGAFSVSIICSIETQEGKDLKVWRIGDNGEKTYATNVQYKDGMVSFDADHLSLYAIGYDSSDEPVPGPSGGDSDGGNNNGMMIYAGIGVVAILAILGIALVVRRSRA